MAVRLALRGGCDIGGFVGLGIVWCPDLDGGGRVKQNLGLFWLLEVLCWRGFDDFWCLAGVHLLEKSGEICYSSEFIAWFCTHRLAQFARRCV